MKDLISVIVPIYNSERYLRECIDSILEQSYKRLEIILINDGSTDNSLDICLEYKKKHKNVIVINQKNSGLSEARNSGIKKATGKYIIFVDADDSIKKDEILYCLKAIKKEKSQMVLFSYDEIYNFKDRKNIKYKKIEKQLPSYKNMWQYGYAWNKMYVTDIIKENKLLFKKDIIFVEDIIFNSEYLMFVNKISFIQESLYNYNKYDNYKTLSNSQHKHFLKMIELSIEYKLKLRDKYFDYELDYEKCLYLFLIRQYVLYLVRENGRLKDKIKKLKICLNNYKNKYKGYRGREVWEKVYLFLIKFNLIFVLYIFTLVCYKIELLRKKFF